MELSNDISALKDLVSVLFRRIETLESENATLRSENAELRLENAELRSRPNLNSKNSQKAALVVADKQTREWAFKHICQLADKEEPLPKQGKRGKPKNSKGRNLLNRLLDHQDRWLAFAFVEGVPFSNNQAERDILCLKTKQKVATNFQTCKGAQHYACIQSFTSTLRKFNERFPEPD